MFDSSAKYDVPIGIQDGKVKCNQLKASSMWDKYHHACRGKLNTIKQGHWRGGWAPRAKYNQWWQVRLSRPTIITRVLTQGRYDLDEWTTSYFVTYSVNGRRFLTYKVGGKRRVGET